ncbi:MAG TPA: hypothetical protein PLY16_01195 [Candidatus Saccharibacteria bacterium]|nr:hypothetical protein [Candidatus Saccharibacteria bacterium]
MVNNTASTSSAHAKQLRDRILVSFGWLAGGVIALGLYLTVLRESGPLSPLLGLAGVVTVFIFVPVLVQSIFKLIQYKRIIKSGISTDVESLEPLAQVIRRLYRINLLVLLLLASLSIYSVIASPDAANGMMAGMLGLPGGVIVSVILAITLIRDHIKLEVNPTLKTPFWKVVRIASWVAIGLFLTLVLIAINASGF